MTSDVQAAVDAGRATAAARQLEAGSYYVVPTRDGVHEIDLTDLHLDRPRRTIRSIRVTDAASFLAYWSKHANADSEVIAYRDALEVVGIVDAPGHDRPNWCDHVIKLRLEYATAWLEWSATDRVWLNQERFAEHLEDHLADIIHPAGAEMLKVAQTLQATTRVSFQSGFRLVDGQRQLFYVEEINGTAGARGELAIPTEFRLGLPIFRGLSVADELRARLRYRIRHGELALSYVLDRAEERVTTAFNAVVDEIAQGTGRPVFRG